MSGNSANASTPVIRVDNTTPQVPNALGTSVPTHDYAQLYQIMRNVQGRKGWLGANRITAGADGFHSFAAALRVHLFQNSMDVVSHRVLRQIQAGSDFLVRQTFGDEPDQLLLTQSEVRLESVLGWHFFGHLSYEAEQCVTKLRRAHSVAPNDRAHRSQELIFIGVHPDQDNFEAKLAHALESKIRGKPICVEGGDDQNIAVRI